MFIYFRYHILKFYFIFLDNPSYFYNDEDSPRTPDSPTRRFFFFRRRSSSSNKLLLSSKSTKERHLSPGSDISALNNCGDHNANHKGTFRSLLRSKSQNNPTTCIYSQVS